VTLLWLHFTSQRLFEFSSTNPEQQDALKAKNEPEKPKEVKPKPKEKEKEKVQEPELTPLEKKLRDQKIVESSDLGNTLELFGTGTSPPPLIRLSLASSHAVLCP